MQREDSIELCSKPSHPFLLPPRFWSLLNCFQHCDAVRPPQLLACRRQGLWRFFRLAMAEVPECLLKAQRWAKHVLQNVGIDKATLLWSDSPLASSSMFSGCCYPERALEYIDAARREMDPTLPPLSDTYLFFGRSLLVCPPIIGGKTSWNGVITYVMYNNNQYPPNLCLQALIHLILGSCNKQIAHLLITAMSKFKTQNTNQSGFQRETSVPQVLDWSLQS